MEQKKQYRSALRSKRMIRQAFMELVQEKDFSKITVTDIVRRADLNRSTFYAHYPDVQGVVEEMLDEVVDSSIQLVRGINYTRIFEEPEPFLRGLMEIGMKNMDLYRLLNDSDFALRQIESIKRVFQEKAVAAVDIPEHVRHSNTYKLQVSFFIGGILNIFQQWMQGNLECTTEEIMEMLADLIRSNAGTYREKT